MEGELINEQETLDGELGYKGERGYSSYEIAVLNGFEGTEQDWLDHFGVDLTGYINTNDVIDNLTSTSTNYPLSANQGKELKGLIDNLDTSLEDLGDNTYDKTETYNKTEVDNKIISTNKYSSTESIIGKDGSDNVYRKMVYFGDITDYSRYDSNNHIYVDTGITNFDYLINLYVIGSDNGTNWRNITNYIYYNGTYAQLSFIYFEANKDSTDGHLYIDMYSNGPDRPTKYNDVRVYIEYVKTGE